MHPYLGAMALIINSSAGGPVFIVKYGLQMTCHRIWKLSNDTTITVISLIFKHIFTSIMQEIKKMLIKSVSCTLFQQQVIIWPKLIYNQ